VDADTAESLGESRQPRPAAGSGCCGGSGWHRVARASGRARIRGAGVEKDVAVEDAEPDVLDRIDEINPPGVTINPADNGWTQPALEPTRRRR